MIIGTETKTESIERTRLAAEYLLRLFSLPLAVEEAQSGYDYALSKNDSDGVAAFTDILDYLKKVIGHSECEEGRCTSMEEATSVT